MVFNVKKKVIFLFERKMSRMERKRTYESSRIEIHSKTLCTYTFVYRFLSFIQLKRLFNFKMSKCQLYLPCSHCPALAKPLDQCKCSQTSRFLTIVLKPNE